MKYWIFLFLVLGPLIFEGWLLRRWRRKIPVVVHVHGSRGKSGTVRRLSSILRGQGLKVLGKTTGDAPEYIMPDGTVRPIRRSGPARIQEHVRAMYTGQALQVDAMVIEGMALQTETLYFSEKILRASHVAITNLRPDHAETMGSGRGGVLNTMKMMLRPAQAVFTSQEDAAEDLACFCEELGSTCTIASSPPTAEQNSILAATVAAGLAGGRFDEEAASSSKITAIDFNHAGKRLRFYDLFSANDVYSSQLLLDEITKKSANPIFRVALLATRADRPLRTKHFMDWLMREARFDLILPLGSHAGYAWLHYHLCAAKQAKIKFFPKPFMRPKALLEKITGLPEHGGRVLEIVGLGNTHGYGLIWRNYLSALGEEKC